MIRVAAIATRVVTALLLRAVFFIRVAAITALFHHTILFLSTCRLDCNAHFRKLIDCLAAITALFHHTILFLSTCRLDCNAHFRKLIDCLLQRFTPADN